MELNELNQATPDVTSIDRNEKRGWRQWNMNQIYMGQDSKGLYVPNVGDIVEDIRGGIIRFKEVVSVDESTLIPTFANLTFAKEDEGELNQFRGVGPGYQSETWRIFYDKSVIPHTLMVDVNLHQYGTDTAYMKLFKGRDTSSTGKVISQYRNSNLDNYSENVPLVTIGSRFDDSNAIKRPLVCHTTEHLEIGEVVTAVTYSASGKACSENTFIVANAANVRSLDAATAYVTGIELISPFISSSDDRLVEFPSNIQRDGLFTMAKVYYSDGSDRILSIDGGRFSILGLDHYISTLRGETNSFGLRYQLADNELAWNTSIGADRHITEIYRYRTLEVDGSYSVNLVAIPRWADATAGYELEYWLFNLDRDIVLNVTDYIEPGANTEIFNGKKFGTVQHISVALELSKLNIGLNSYRHVQNFQIGLSGNPLNYDVPYLIQYHVSQTPGYGTNTKLKMTRRERADEIGINLNGYLDFRSLDLFLEGTYYQTKPLFDENVEAKAPVPTHFSVTTPDGTSMEFEIEKWNQEVGIPNNPQFPMVEGSTLTIEWLRKLSPTETQHLSVTPMILRY